MKKTLRKLTLSRETLRSLETPDLHQAGAGPGGPKTFQTQTCDTNCDCTLSCPELCHFTTV
jgi:hypothetical protein